MKQRYSKKYSQGYGTMLVALIGAAGVAGSIGYEARLQGQTGERNESLKGYLQARELASERIMMMLAELEKSTPTAVALQGVNANAADVAIQNVSPKSIVDLSAQSSVNFDSMEQKMRQEVEASSGWRNASLSLDTQMIGAAPRVIRDANSIPVSLEYTIRVKGKGYYFCPSAGSQSGCATGEAATDFRWKVPLQVAALPPAPPPPPPASSSDPCAAYAPQNVDPNSSYVVSTAIATNDMTLTCTSGNVGPGGTISGYANASNGQGSSNTQGTVTYGHNGMVSTTTGQGSYAGHTITNGNGVSSQTSGSPPASIPSFLMSGSSGASASSGMCTAGRSGEGCGSNSSNSSSSTKYYTTKLDKEKANKHDKSPQPWKQKK